MQPCMPKQHTTCYYTLTRKSVHQRASDHWSALLTVRHSLLMICLYMFPYLASMAHTLDYQTDGQLNNLSP